MSSVTYTRLATVIMSVPFLTACGSGIDGTYLSKDGGRIPSDKIVLKSGHKVEITAMGQTKAGNYELEDKKVKIIIAGENVIFTIDDKGCLDGGNIVGTFCKE
jgi:hypothetical protein